MSSARFGRRSKLGPGRPLAWGKSPPPKVATGRTGRVFPVRRRRNLGGGGWVVVATLPPEKKHLLRQSICPHQNKQIRMGFFDLELKFLLVGSMSRFVVY